MRRTLGLIAAQVGGGALSLLILVILAVRWCEGSCYGEVDGLPAEIAFVIMLVSTVTVGILAAGASPSAERSTGGWTASLALPFGVAATLVAADALGAGSGDYSVMEFVALLFGLASFVLWLIAGLSMAWHARRRLPHSSRFPPLGPGIGSMD